MPSSGDAVPGRDPAPRPPGSRRRALALAIICTLIGGLAAVAPVVPAAAAYTTTVRNFNSSGQQVTRYDTEGDAVDAHDGDLALFGDTYYLYGTSYDCGYRLQVTGSKFCGFKVYSSPDLVNWTDRGFLFDATTALWQGRCAPPMYGCYRPHVVYNGATARYVLWVNGYDNASGYHVFVSETPTGPFTEVAEPTLASQGTGAGFNNGDMDVFVDDDGTAYLAYSDIRGNHDQVVERLNASYTSGTGQYTRLGQTGREAPSLFRRNNTYYYVYGPNCPYCGGTSTLVRTASSPLGPWSAERSLNSNSCGGQPSFVAKLGSTYLYGSDLWNNYAANEALANFFWTPLSFDAAGAVAAFGCAATVNVTLDVGSAGGPVIPADLDQADGSSGFRTWCDIKSGWQRMQSFVTARTGTLTSANLTTFQKDLPNAGLTVQIYEVNSSSQTVGGALFTQTIAAGSIGWSPRNVTVRPNIAVRTGARYGIVARSSATTGCYGFAFNDAAPYPGGGEAYSTNGGASYIVETNRSLKFVTTSVGEVNLAIGATPTASSNYFGYGWSLPNANDASHTSTASSMGWTSDNSPTVNHAEYYQLDVGTPRTMSRIELYPRNDAGNVGQGFPVDFTVRLSVDGVSWTTVVTRTEYPLPHATAQAFSFPAQSARYVRIDMTSLRNTNPNDRSYRAQFAEVELF